MNEGNAELIGTGTGSRQDYAAPQLVDYGSVDELTKTTGIGAFDDGFADASYAS